MGVTIVGRGTATPPQVLANVPFSSDSGTNQTGTMPNIGSANLTPSGTGTVPIPAGYHDGTGVVEQVAVPAADVLTGTNIAGVAGTMPDLSTTTSLQPGATIGPGYIANVTGQAVHGSQLITSSGTFTVGTGVTQVTFIAVGGGSGANNSYSGNAGAVVIKTASVSASDAYTVTIGAGSSYYSASTGGTAGGTTSVTGTGVSLTANGGAAPAASPTAATASGGDYDATGAAGGITSSALGSGGYYNGSEYVAPSGYGSGAAAGSGTTLGHGAGGAVLVIW